MQDKYLEVDMLSRFLYNFDNIANLPCREVVPTQFPIQPPVLKGFTVRSLDYKRPEAKTMPLLLTDGPPGPSVVQLVNGNLPDSARSAASWP